MSTSIQWERMSDYELRKSMAQVLWLNYFNQTLVEAGIITERRRNQLKRSIMARCPPSPVGGINSIQGNLEDDAPGADLGEKTYARADFPPKRMFRRTAGSNTLRVNARPLPARCLPNQYSLIGQFWQSRYPLDSVNLPRTRWRRLRQAEPDIRSAPPSISIRPAPSIAA